MSNTIDEIIEIAKTICKGKKGVNASHTVNKYKIEISYAYHGTILTITDNTKKNKYGYYSKINIHLVDVEPENYGEELFREVVDLTARNYRGKKKNIKDETLKNIRGVYQKVAGNSIESQVGVCQPHEEVAHFLGSIMNWSEGNLSFAYRVIGSQSKNIGEYSMFVADLKLVLKFISAFAYDFDDLQLKLEEALLTSF